jgi:hypothetical protein
MRVGTQTAAGRRNGSRSAKLYRGGRGRLKRIRLRGNGSWELLALVIWVVFLLLVVVPWILRQGR